MADIGAENLETELRDIIARITEIEPERITLDAKFVEDLGMDSMMALEILAAIEKKYKIKIPESKLMSLSNLHAAIGLTKEYLKLKC